MEGIVRKTWKADPATDICFVYTLAGNMLETLKQERFPRTVTAMEKVADHYGIPSIHMGLEVARMEREGKLVFSGAEPKTDAERANLGDRILFSPDAVHPYDAGHQVYFEAVVRSWEEIRGVGGPAPHELVVPMVADNWERAEMVPFGKAKLSAGWEKLESDAGVVKSFGNRVPGLWKAKIVLELGQIRTQTLMECLVVMIRSVDLKSDMMVRGLKCVIDESVLPQKIPIGKFVSQLLGRFQTKHFSEQVDKNILWLGT